MATSTSTPPARRVRTEGRVKAFGDLDLSKVEVRALENGKRKFFLPLIDGESGSINLTPDATSCEVLFGLRTDGQYEKPSFLGGGGEEAKGREGLGMVLVPDDALKTFLKGLDAAVEAKFREAGGRGEWHPLVAPKGTLDADGFKLKVILSGPRGLTDVKVRDANGTAGGSGWEALKDLVAFHRGFKGLRVKVAARIHSVWSVSGRSGLSLHASFLVVDASEGPAAAKEASPFGETCRFQSTGRGYAQLGIPMAPVVF